MAKSPAWADEEQKLKFCTHCMSTFELSGFYTSGKKKDGTPKYASWCRSCVSDKQASYHERTWGPDKRKYVSFKRTKSVRAYLNYLRSKAKARKKGGEVISLDALELMWTVQNGLCALTKWPMTMELDNGTVATNCSIDRIDSSKGYIVGNVQLVCRAANVAKHDLTTADFINLCKAVVASNGI